MLHTIIFMFYTIDTILNKLWQRLRKVKPIIWTPLFDNQNRTCLKRLFSDEWHSGQMTYGMRDTNNPDQNQLPIRRRTAHPSTCLHKTWPGFLSVHKTVQLFAFNSVGVSIKSVVSDIFLSNWFLRKIRRVYILPGKHCVRRK